MLDSLIEQKRTEMYSAYMEQNNLDRTVIISQELDHLLNIYDFSKKIIPLDNKAKVHKSAILNIRDVVFANEPSYIPLLEKYKVAHENNDWYHLETLNSIFSEIKKKDRNYVLEHIGSNVPMKCLFPENLNSFEQSISSIDHAFQMNHIDGSVGMYKSGKIDESNIMLVCNTPAYPSEFNYGVICGLAKKFNEGIQVTYHKTINGGEFKIKLVNPVKI